MIFSPTMQAYADVISRGRYILFHQTTVAVDCSKHRLDLTVLAIDTSSFVILWVRLYSLLYMS